MTIIESKPSQAAPPRNPRAPHQPPAVPARPADGPPCRGAYWQYIVLTRVEMARNDLMRVRAQPAADDDGLDQIDDLLATAAGAASTTRRWPAGSATNRAFTHLHAAQVILARYTPDEELEVRLLSAMARLRATILWTEPRRYALEYSYRSARSAPQDAARNNGRLKRWILEKALEVSYAATDAQYARLRSFRNVLTVIFIALLAVALGLGVMCFLWPAAMQLCFNDASGAPRICPTGSAASSRDGLVIEVLGATGGALAAVLSVRKMQGTSTPYSVPLALAMLKLPLGAVSALVGLLLVHGRFIPGLTDLDTSGQILAYAVFLGVAQQSITALIDRHGHDLLEQLPSKRGRGDPPGRLGPHPEELPRGREPGGPDPGTPEPAASPVRSDPGTGSDR